MTTPTHIAIGYFIARGFATSGLLPDTNSTYLLSMVFANAPDVDGLFFTRRLYTHRENFYALSHYPATWFVLWSIMLLIVWNLPSVYFYYMVMFGASMSSHFILDSLDLFDGIAWFGPWIKKKYSLVPLLPSPQTNTEWSMVYRKHWLFYIEVALCLAAFTIAFIT